MLHLNHVNFLCVLFLFLLTYQTVSFSLQTFAFTSSVWTDFGEESTHIMAAAAAVASTSKGSLREDLTCAICCDLFREPVMLACMHHFCKPCISRYWRGTQGPVTCPQCRKEFSSKQFQTNYLVTAMVEKVRATTSDTYIKNLEVSLRLHFMLNRDPAGCLPCLYNCHLESVINGPAILDK